MLRQCFTEVEPIGQNDTVTVKVTQFTDTIDYQMLFDQYEQEKSKRSSAELVEGIGQESYIAFPTIHVVRQRLYN